MSDLFFGSRRPTYPAGAGPYHPSPSAGRHFWQQKPAPPPPPQQPQHPSPQQQQQQHRGSRTHCAAAGCGDYAETTARHGQPPGFCPHHACKKSSCGGGRIDGSAYCLKHACDVSTCSRSKLDTSAFCNQHACQYSGCTSSKRGAWTVDGVTSEACEDHVCQSKGCSHPRRHHRSYCREHSCGWSGRMPCNQEVEAGGSRACRDHVCQFEGGCRAVRKVKTNGEACDEHTCRIAGCYGAVGVRGRYCRDHTCAWEPCSQRGGYGASPFCDVHKCRTKGCQTPVASKIDSYCAHHRCQYGGGTCLGGFRKFPPFCEDHTCHVKGCHEPVHWETTVCKAHVGHAPSASAPPPPPPPKSTTPTSRKASSVFSGHGGGGRKESKEHKSKSSKMPVAPEPPYVEETAPSTCSNDSWDEKDQVGSVSGRSQKPARSNAGEQPDDDDDSGEAAGAASSSAMVRRGQWDVATAVHGEVAVRRDLADYAVARRQGLNVPVPAVVRTDPNYALAYGCGMQDAVHLMAEMYRSGAGFPSSAGALGSGGGGGGGGPSSSSHDNREPVFAQGAFAEMDRHLPTFEGQRVVEEE